MPFTGSYNAAYKILFFHRFKLKLTRVCRELNSVSYDKKVKINVLFLRSNMRKEKNVAKVLPHSVFYRIDKLHSKKGMYFKKKIKEHTEPKSGAESRNAF